MKPTKQTVYLPTTEREFYLSDFAVTGVKKEVGYFFTPKQLQNYTKNVIKKHKP